MSKRVYVEIATRYEDFDMIEVRVGPKSSMCRKCHKVDWRTYPRMLSGHVSASLGAKLLEHRVSHLGASSAPVVHRDLWRVLRPHASSVVMGPVTTEVGEVQQLMLDWTVLCFPKELRVCIRGDQPVRRNWHCAECGDIKHSPSGRNVLVESDLPRDAFVLVSGGMLLIEANLYKSVESLGFESVEAKFIPVVPKALDGLEAIGGEPG